MFDNDCSSEVSHSQITDNVATGATTRGGGISLAEYCYPTFFDCLLVSNETNGSGGAVYCEAYCDPVFASCTLWNNSAGTGSTLFSDGRCQTTLTDTVFSSRDGEVVPTGSSIVATFCCVEGGWRGTGNQDADPLFAAGRLGPYYFSSVSAGQETDSPCLNAGSSAATALGLDELTTTTDEQLDEGVVDIGYHYPSSLARIDVSVNSPAICRGEELVVSVEVSNPGEPISIDAYVGLVLPTGDLYCLKPDGTLGVGMYPLAAGVNLPEGFTYGPVEIMRFLVPDSAPTGGYLAAGALLYAGESDLVTSPDTVFFEVL